METQTPSAWANAVPALIGLGGALVVVVVNSIVLWKLTQRQHRNEVARAARERILSEFFVFSEAAQDADLAIREVVRSFDVGIKKKMRDALGQLGSVQEPAVYKAVTRCSASAMRFYAVAPPRLSKLVQAFVTEIAKVAEALEQGTVPQLANLDKLSKKRRKIADHVRDLIGSDEAAPMDEGG